MGGLNSQTPPDFTALYYTPILELTMMMLDYYEFTGDTAFAQDTLVPIATAGMQFFNGFFGRDSSWNIALDPDNANETYWSVNDPAPDIAGLQAVLPRLIALPSNVVSGSTVATWSAMLAQVPPLPTGTLAGTRVILPYTGPQTAVSRNSENPELYSVYPFRLYGLGKPEFDLAYNTFNTRLFTQMGGWVQDPIEAAMVGLPYVAQSYVTYNFTATDTRQKFQAFWAALKDYPPSQPNGENGVNGLQQMIMQYSGSAIMIAPAWPSGWNCNFKLNAPYQTTVQGSIIGGTVTKLIVTPSSRAANVTNMAGLTTSCTTGYSIVSTQDAVVGLSKTTPSSANVLAVSGTDYNPTEAAPNVIDGSLATKYYNKAQDGSNAPGDYTGFVITPVLGASIINAIQLATANDMPTRDPVNITIEGSNAPNAGQAGGNGFNLIYSGPSGLLPNQDRESWGLFVNFANTAAYTTYRVLVASTAGGTSSDGAQYSEVNLFGRLKTALSGSCFLSGSDTIVGIKETAVGGTNVLAVSGSDYPSNQGPTNIIDGNTGTKYYNTAKEMTYLPGVNTGFVITPNAGAKIINGFQIATANDMPTRDPISITIEGSNSANATRAGASSFTLIYSGPSGLETGLARCTYGPIINFWNTTRYTSYRVLVTGVAGSGGNGTQYSEVKLFGN